ncbi:hypothetical protein HU200_033349 [Digitaria exilis]|uniref:Uncharacterized protein n=1 Tax=Digitaria exilis TaxID=1010633 RepID=A0A835BLW9_9POAL|nr:hypothetical protein HU200_033349 [Digitaria exilis]
MAVSAASPAATTPPRDVDAARADPRRLLLLKAADAAPFAFIGAMWINQLASAASVAARRACGEGSRAVGLAREAAYGAFLVMAALLPLAHQRMVIKLNSKIEQLLIDLSLDLWIIFPVGSFSAVVLCLRSSASVGMAALLLLRCLCWLSSAAVGS